MKTLVPILGLLLAPGSVQEPSPTRETIREAYPDGSPRLEVEAVRAADGDLVLDGKYVRFHPEGSRACVGSYRQGQRQDDDFAGSGDPVGRLRRECRHSGRGQFPLCLETPFRYAVTGGDD